MSVTLELRPEIEERVTAEAAARGLSVEEYLTSIIEGSALRGSPDATLEEFEAAMDLLAEGSGRGVGPASRTVT
jgi:hypothetical protein